MQIALISDNHGYNGADVLKYIKDCDEVWHAGDIGSIESLAKIKEISKIRAVYGNIDDFNIRNKYPYEQNWNCEGLNIFMTHIGGYPGRYKKKVFEKLNDLRPDIYICGHSHICKVMKDKDLNILHMNPGAYGHQGFHKIRTMLKFKIENGVLSDLKVVELGYRGVGYRMDNKKV